MANEVKKETVNKTVPKPTKPKKEAVKYYFPKSSKKSYRTADFRVKAENNIYILDPANKQYDDIKEYLDTHKDNVDNGGRVYTVLSDKAGEESDRGKLIDKLLGMDESQIRRICGDSVELQLITSKGQLIDTYLTQQKL